MITKLAKKTNQRTINARELLTEVIKDNPKASEAQHKVIFDGMMLAAEYEDYAANLRADWLQIVYGTCYRTAFPPTLQQITQRVTQRTTTVAAIKAKALQRILNGEFIMPNGLPLFECTCGYCAKLGGKLAAIGKAGKPNQLVGSLPKAKLKKLLSQ